MAWNSTSIHVLLTELESGIHVSFRIMLRSKQLMHVCELSSVQWKFAARGQVIDGGMQIKKPVRATAK